MSSIKFLYDSAELAQAAYANLAQGETDLASNLDALRASTGAEMSQKQAEKFAARYTEVVTQFNDTETSFSSTIFKEAVTGNLTLAIKGTLEGGDFIPTDADILSHGAGYDQIVAMYNWWQRASSSTGEAVQQFKLEWYQDGIDTVPAGAVFLYRTEGSGPIPIGQGYYLVPAAETSATGELVGALVQDIDHLLNVTGHSLGGHLAMAFGALFNGQTDQVTTFNAPGFDTNPNVKQAA